MKTIIESLILACNGLNGLHLVIILILCFSVGYALKWACKRQIKSNEDIYYDEMLFRNDRRGK